MREVGIDVIKKAASGDVDAFEEIYKTFSSTVYTLALNVTRNRHDAEEVTQDVFIKIFQGLKHFKFESSLGTWIYRMALNTAINMYHSRARRGLVTMNIEDAGDIPSPENVNSVMDRKDAESRVSDIMKNLNPQHKACIVLREIEGLNYKEMADVLGIPLNTVRSRLKRAREAMIAYCRSKEVSYGL